MSKENMGRNAEHYADPTPTAAMRNICRDEYQKEAARLDRIGDIVPLLRQMRPSLMPSTAAAPPCSLPPTMCTSGGAWPEKGGFER